MKFSILLLCNSSIFTRMSSIIFLYGLTNERQAKQNMKISENTHRTFSIITQFQQFNNNCQNISKKNIKANDMTYEPGLISYFVPNIINFILEKKIHSFCEFQIGSTFFQPLKRSMLYEICKNIRYT